MEKPSAEFREPNSEPKTIDRMPSLLTVDEAAAFFRINRKTLYEAIRLEQVPALSASARASGSAARR
jgi:hypothetical protein